MCDHPGMGRHARGAARSRVPVATIVARSLIVVVIAVGSWLGSRAQPTPIAAGSVDGSAVVVSSLACTDGAGGTVVDVLEPGRRSAAPSGPSLDACGYQEGQLLAVQYPAGDPTQAGAGRTDAVDRSRTGDRLLPIGLAGRRAARPCCAGDRGCWLDAPAGRQPSVGPICRRRQAATPAGAAARRPTRSPTDRQPTSGAGIGAAMPRRCRTGRARSRGGRWMPACRHAADRRHAPLRSAPRHRRPAASYDERPAVVRRSGLPVHLQPGGQPARRAVHPPPAATVHRQPRLRVPRRAPGRESGSRG